MNTYAESRKNLIYYKYLRSLLSFVARDTDAIIDIGSNGVDMLSFLPCKRKVSVDLYNPLVKAGVLSLKQDFFDYTPSEKFDIACCFQVIEHIEKAEIFSQKILEIGKICIISVPYKWKKGACKYHVQDPVDEDKLIAWFKKEPVFCEIIDTRIIAVFISDEATQAVVTNLNEMPYLQIMQKKISNQTFNVDSFASIYARSRASKLSCTRVCISKNDPKVLYDEILAHKGDITIQEELFRIGIDLFPFHLDQYGHPVFLKEYVRFLLALERFKDALRFFAKVDGIYHGMYGKKFILILLARAYEKCLYHNRSYHIWRYLEKCDYTSAEVLQAVNRLQQLK